MYIIVCLGARFNSFKWNRKSRGWIHNDTVWTAVNSPYIVHSFLYIASGVTLTLEAEFRFWLWELPIVLTGI